MKKTSLKQSLLAFIASIAVILVTGCASNHAKNPVDDETLTTNVKLALYSNKAVSAKKIIVATSEGIVHLSGFVKDPEQIGVAEEVTRKVSGVNEVDNRLEVDVPSEPVLLPKSTGIKHKPKFAKTKVTKGKVVKAKSKVTKKTKTTAKSTKAKKGKVKKS